jgi:lia operon protein LiaG
MSRGAWGSTVGSGAWLGLSIWWLSAVPALGLSEQPARHTIPGGEVAIYNLVGSVEVVPGEGSSIVAEVTLRGKDTSRLEVRKGPIGGRETLRVVYPGDRVVVPEFGEHTTSTLRVNDDGTFGEDRRGGRRITLSGKGPGIEAAADLLLLVPPGKKLHVIWGHGTGRVSGVHTQLSLEAAHMPLEVSGFQGPLAIDLGSGNVQVSKSETELSVDTGSGDVTLDGVRGANLGVDTGSGDVAADELHAENLAVDTGSGEIRLRAVRAEAVGLDTGSGRVSVELLGTVNNLVVDSGSGDVDVLIPRGTGALLSVETATGRIETNLAIETRSTKSGELEGRIGDGRGRIRIETGSGSIWRRESGSRSSR